MSRAQVNVLSDNGNYSAVYTTLKEAFESINTGVHTQDIVITITGSTSEPGTAVLNASGTVTGSGTANYSFVTISPSGGDYTISGTVAGAPLIDLNGADSVKIDGLNTGGNSLTIENLSTANTANTSTIRFINDATGDTITNCTILGSNTLISSAAGGVIFFSTTTGTTGNDNNAIIGCDIGPAAAGFPAKTIHALGTSTNATTLNSGILIQNCLIHDYFSAGVSHAGISLLAGNTGWVIDNNKFYQTAARTITSASVIHSGITVNGNTQGSNNNLKITNNTIGYGSSDGIGMDSISTTATSAQFIGIHFVSATTTTAATIQGNTITAIRLTGNAGGATSVASPFMGIYIASGVATITGNTIGSQTETDAITFTSTNAGTNAECIGIHVTSQNSGHIVSNNLIGGITASNTNSATRAASITGIRTNASTNYSITITNNIVGGTVANSIQSTTAAATTPLPSTVIGISVPGPVATITGNTVRNLTSASISTGATISNTSVIGIANSGVSAISNNTVYGLTNTAATAATVVTGLFNTGGTAVTMNRNIIHSLNNTSTAGIIHGIFIGNGPTTCSNNMIRLGIDTTGADITNSLQINGIYETTGANNIYYNSVYIGGTNVDGASTYAFNSTVATGARNYINNIFMNARSNGTGTGTGKHYAVKVGGAVVNPLGLTMKNNLFYTNGIGGMFGSFNGSDIEHLSAWQAAVGGNIASGFGDPQFLAPTGNAATVDLHIDQTVSTPVEGMGAVIAVVTTDYDMTARNSGTPDIGADEGSFTLMDVYAPVITYTKLSNHNSTTVRTVSSFAAITDISGVNTTAGTRPRLYFKKSQHANTYADNTSLTDGWKYVEATNVSSPFSFDINYSLIFGGTVSVLDTIQYFITAQDNMASVAINAGSYTAIPTSVALTAASFPIQGTLNSYLISPNAPLSGVIPVGSGNTYTTLNAITADLALRGIDGSVLIELTDAVYTSPAETFPIVFGNIGGTDAAKTVTIRPTIAGTTIMGSDTIIIDLNNVNNVIIDGRIGGLGSGKDLIIENTNTGASSTVRFINDACKNTIRYCTVKGVATAATSGTLLFGTTTGTVGNDTNTIDNCDIGDGASSPVQGVYALGETANTIVYNDNNIISNSNIYNYFHATNASTGIRVNAGNAGWKISNNSFYQTAPVVYTSNVIHRAILINSVSANVGYGSGFEVSNNMIGGSGPGLDDTLRITSAGAVSFTGIECSVGMDAANPTLIQNNTFSNIRMEAGNSLGNTLTGINIERGATTIDGNTIGSATTVGAIDFTTTVSLGGVFGIRLGNTNPIGATTINNNTISGIELKGASSSIVANWTGIAASGGTTTNITNNTIGSATMANAINAPIPILTTTSQTLRGIIVNGTATTFNVTGNVIANINTNTVSTGTTGHTLMAIVYSPGTANANPINISNNIIHDLSSSAQTTQTTVSPVLGGIIISTVTSVTGVLTVANNQVYGLKLTGSATSAAVVARGIYVAGGAINSEVANNKVHSFSVSAANPSAVVTAIQAAGVASGGSCSYYNNFIRLGVDDQGNEDNNGYQITGINETVTAVANANHNFYYNSVYIGGFAVSSGTSKTYAFNSVSTGTRSYINNSFYNARSNGAASGTHYAVKVAGTSANPSGLTMNNNLLYASGGSGAMLGFYNNVDISDLSTWETTVGGNANSISTDPWYKDPMGSALLVDLAPQNGSPLFNSGVNIPSVTTDMLGLPRNPITPTIGAGETTTPLPVKLLSFTGVKEQGGVRLNWVTASELNNAYFNVQRSLNGSDFETIATVKGNGTTQRMNRYSYADTKRVSVSRVYYRLVQVDFNRNSQTSAVVVIDFNKADQSTSFSVVPNPFEGMPTLVINSELASQATVRVVDLTGRIVVEKSILLETGQNQVEVEELLAGHKGMYVIQVVTPSGVMSQRALKLN